MIHSHRSLFPLILGIVLFVAFSGYAHAQQDTSAPDKEEVAALREKAFKLLESVAGQLNTLQSGENRARMASNILHSIWKHDEARARSLLRLVQDDIKTELQKPDRADPEYDETFKVFLRLRQDTLDRLVKHDAETALEFLKVTEPVFKNEAPPEFVENERALQLKLAKQVAASHPDVALKLGRQALKQNFSRDLLLLLGKLNRNHRQNGQTLYKEIVDKFRDADLNNDWNARQFARGLIQLFPPPEADESTFRELVGFLVDKALANGCSDKLPVEEERAEFCVWVTATIRPAQTYDSRTARMKHWDRDTHDSPRFSFGFQEMEELFQEERDLDKIDAFSLKYPELKPVAQMRAINSATFSGDFDLARKLIDRYITDPERHKQLVQTVENRKESAKFNEQKLADIQAKLQEMADDQQRVWFLLAAANQVGSVDHKVALKLLNQAGEIVETLKPGKDQTRSRVGLAMMYCAEKNERGFAIMESVVPKLNELVEVAIKLDGYDTNYLRDGEWNMSSNGSIGEILKQLSDRAGFFAWCDFNRAVTLASQFERVEIRLMAHLKLAQAILAGPPPRYSAR